MFTKYLKKQFEIKNTLKLLNFHEMLNDKYFDLKIHYNLGTKKNNKRQLESIGI